MVAPDQAAPLLGRVVGDGIAVALDAAPGGDLRPRVPFEPQPLVACVACSGSHTIIQTTIRSLLLHLSSRKSITNGIHTSDSQSNGLEFLEISRNS